MHYKISIGNYLIVMTFRNSGKNILYIGLLRPHCFIAPEYWLRDCDLISMEGADHLLMELSAVSPGHQLTLLHSLHIRHRVILGVANLK